MTLFERILLWLSPPPSQKRAGLVDPLAALYREAVGDGIELLLSARPAITSRKIEAAEMVRTAAGDFGPRLRRILAHGEDDVGCVLFSAQIIASLFAAAGTHQPKLFEGTSQEDTVAELTRIVADRLLRFFLVEVEGTETPSTFCFQTYEPLHDGETQNEYFDECECIRITAKELGPVYLLMESGRARALRTKLKTKTFCDALASMEGERLDAGSAGGFQIDIKNPAQFFLGSAFFPGRLVYEGKRLEARVTRLSTTDKAPVALPGGTVHLRDQTFSVGFSTEAAAIPAGLIAKAFEHFAFVFSPQVGEVMWAEENVVEFDIAEPLLVCIEFRLKNQQFNVNVELYFHADLLRALYDACVPWFLLRSMRGNLSNLLLSALSFNLHAGDFLSERAVDYYSILPASSFAPDCYPFFDFISACRRREARVILQLLAANLPADTLTQALHADGVVRLQSSKGEAEVGIVIIQERWHSLARLKDPAVKHAELQSQWEHDLRNSALAGDGYRVVRLWNPEGPKLANRQVMELLHKMMKEDRVELSTRARALLAASFRKADEQKLRAELESLRKADFPWKDLLRDVQILRDYVRASGFTSETVVSLLALDWSRPEIRSAVFVEVSLSNRGILNEEIQRIEGLMRSGEKSYRLAIEARHAAAAYLKRAKERE